MVFGYESTTPFEDTIHPPARFLGDRHDTQPGELPDVVPQTVRDEDNLSEILTHLAEVSLKPDDN